MLDQTLAQMMQRLLEKDANSTPVGATVRRLQEELGIGRIRGKTLYLSERDHQEMRDLLRARGYSLSPLSLKEMSRSDRLAVGTPNEKAGGGALKSCRVSIKALPGKALNIAGKVLSLPDGSHIDIDWRGIDGAIGHDAIMLVENYEVFDQIHRLSFDLPSFCTNPLVIYRGDKNESRQDNVKVFLDAIALPVLAFVDIDPKGLHIAGCCPRLAGIVAPGFSDLNDTLASPASARHDLYRKQLSGVENYLLSVEDESPIAALWKLVRQYRAGAVQERWMAAGFTQMLWVGGRRLETNAVSEGNAHPSA